MSKSVNRRYLAVTVPLAAILLIASGCAASSSRKPRSETQVAHAPANAPMKKNSVLSASPTSRSVLTEVEAPKMATATKFEDAQDAVESPQSRSMREQMARRYGCCGR